MDALSLARDFARRYGRVPDGVWMAPGRVNLIGEHTDYNEGFVLPFAIGQSTLAAAAVRADGMVRVCSTLREAQGTVCVGPADLVPGAVTGWAAYPLGVVWALRQAGQRVPGLDLLIDSDVPVGAGLSSSAAIECAVAVAANALADAGRTRPELALAGQQAENEMVGAPTGIMDQTASLLGRAGHAVFLDCRSRATQLVPLPLAAAGMVLQVVNTRVRHAHATGGYAQRRAECSLGAELMGVPSLRDLSEADLPEACGLLEPDVFRRVRHVVTENARVLAAVTVLGGEGGAGDAGAADDTDAGERLAALAPLLNASHASMRDDFAISCPELDLAVDTALAHGALGARMNGGGFGGSVIALTPVDGVRAVHDGVLAAFAQAGCLTPQIFTVSPSDGARRLA